MTGVIFIIILVVVIFLARQVYKNGRRNALLRMFQEIHLEESGERDLLETVTTPDRGTRSERETVLRLLEYGIPSATVFHDLYVKRYYGGFTQIDLAVATTAGIIVFEVKDYSGWIFGRGYQSQWTQVLAYGREKYRFYNPIMQNNRHIEELRKQCRQFESIPFFSVVVFYGDCDLKGISFVPEGTFVVKPSRLFDVVDIIRNYAPANYTDKSEVLRVLSQAVRNGDNPDVRVRHIRNVNDMLGKERILELKT